jgi:hypothetical protein
MMDENLYTLESTIKILEDAGVGNGRYAMSLKRALESRNRGDKVIVAEIPLEEPKDD